MQPLGGWHPLLPDKPLEQTTSKETNKKDKQATSKNIQKTSNKQKIQKNKQQADVRQCSHEMGATLADKPPSHLNKRHMCRM